MSRSVLEVLRGVAKARAWWLTPWQQGGGDDSPQSALAHFVTASDGAEQAAATVERMAEALEAALTRMPHSVECITVLPTTEWEQRGSVSVDKCCCAIKTVNDALRAYRGEQA